MSCAHCHEDKPLDASGFCTERALQFDGWKRQYASDIVPGALGAMVIVLGFGLGIPILGASYLLALGGVFAGFGVFVGSARWNGRRRRRQFLSTSLPRAYLPTKT
jgi:hypothetical protein